VTCSIRITAGTPNIPSLCFFPILGIAGILPWLGRSLLFSYRYFLIHLSSYKFSLHSLATDEIITFLVKKDMSSGLTLKTTPPHQTAQCTAHYSADTETCNYNENYWVSGFCSSPGILNTIKHNGSETGSVSILRWGEGNAYSGLLIEVSPF
jgi:hypothetical protein